MIYERYAAPLHVRILANIEWHIKKYAETIISDCIAGLGFVGLLILPVIMASLH